MRFAVVGASGSGKTTLARALAARLGVPHVELDALHHQAGWTPRDRDALRADVSARVAGAAWVVDGNYRSLVGDLVWGRAETVLWLDLPRAATALACLGRTVRRGVTREELWNGNRERLRNLFSLEPTTNLVLWSWTTHPQIRADLLAANVDPRWAHLRFVRLRSRAEAVAVIERLAPDLPGC